MMKITCVSYINSTPFIDGITRENEAHPMAELSLDIPSESGRKLKEKLADVGLVPVAVIPELQEHAIISNYCISAFREVKSVCLFSQVPLDEITDVLLDFHSMTSVKLVQVLNTFYWKKNIRFIPALPGFIDSIKGSTAGVVIGDRTFGMHEKYRYVYDLSEEWYQFTGMPFVFAAWVSVNPQLSDSDISRLNKALENGIKGIPAKEAVLRPPNSPFDYYEYLTKNIRYHMGEAEKNAMKLFHELMAKL